MSPPISNTVVSWEGWECHQLLPISGNFLPSLFNIYLKEGGCCNTEYGKAFASVKFLQITHKRSGGILHLIWDTMEKTLANVHYIWPIYKWTIYIWPIYIWSIGPYIYGPHIWTKTGMFMQNGHHTNAL